MSVISRAFELLFPTPCAYCRSPVGTSRIPFFCSSCWSDFSVVPEPLCPRCGRPFAAPAALEHSPSHTCVSCRTYPPAFDQALSVGQFEGALREAIHQFKYRPCRSLGAPLARWMIDRLRPLGGIDVVMPVPLHRSRLRQRGFNQALLLARPIAEAARCALSYDNLRRLRPTRPQVELAGEERIRNVRGAFGLSRPAEVEGKDVLVVDDVFTTGATMQECAAVIKACGARSVVCLTLARTVDL